MKTRFFFRVPRVTLLKILPWSCKLYHRFAASHSIVPSLDDMLKHVSYRLWCENTVSKT